MDAYLARVDRMHREIRQYQRHVSGLRNHRIFGVGAALAHASAGVSMHVAHDYPPLVGADVPEFAVRQTLHVYAALQAVRVKIVEEDYPRNDAAIASTVSQ
jgi:hypothetical protein